MKLTDIINTDQVYLNLNITNKKDLFEFASAKLVDHNSVTNSEDFVKALNDRELESPTGFGENWAIPHGISASVKKPTVLYISLKSPIKYESLEGDTADKFFFIAIPKELRGEHVKIISGIATLLLDEKFKNSIKDAKDSDQVINLISSSGNSEITTSKNSGKKVVAVCACTTGIAHTYMAEKALADAAAEMGISIFIEKQGAAGIEDKLTANDIKEADVVILAIEKGINESRFGNKQVLKVSPGRAIKEAKLVIEDALKGINTYKMKESDEENSDKSGSSVKGVYQHLMAGVSYMIPVVVAGGLAIALSFAFGITAFEVEGSLPWALFEIGANSALALMFPVLAGFIAYDIADKPGFAPGIIGGFIANQSGSGFIGAIIAGYMAGYLALYINKKVKFPKSIQGLKTIVVLPVVTTLIVGLFLLFVVAAPIVSMQTAVATFLNDISNNNAGAVILSLAFSVFYFDLGGPISKMVYAFAVALLADKIYTPMAAVMIIGMIPPISMFIATTLRPKLFKEDEKESGKTALLLGMSFITEGAIPFAISRPKQAIPSFIVGGFIGSLISLSLNIGVTAPHGGLFLAFIPNAITNPILFVVALGVGSLVSAISMITLMSFEKPKQ